MATHSGTLTQSVGGVRRARELAAHLMLVLTIGCVAALAGLVATGHKALVVRSGSMSPAIDTGDLVISKVVSPRDVSVGEVVTFTDPGNAARLVTHRVKKVTDEGHRIAFVTKGDANNVSEKWSVAGDGTIGKVQFTIADGGWAFGWVAQPRVLTVVSIGTLLIGLIVGLRMIWRT